MAVYISGTACISPQPTRNYSEWAQQPLIQQALMLRCIEPESYRDYINPVISRRLSRVIKMGIASALMSLRDSGIGMPGAVITGTGMGCVDDTEKFLTTMLDNNETLLNPTNFIQSTYNTISSQIAIALKCFNYNSTYVNRGFSFESALIDGIDLIETGEADSVLAGGVDEITENHFKITGLTGMWRNREVSTDGLIGQPGKGTIAGEGAVFATLTSNPADDRYAKLCAVKTLFEPDSIREVARACIDLINKSAMTGAKPDLVLCGFNGDAEGDALYHDFLGQIGNPPAAAFKHFCGEYHTASAFAFWLAANILKTGIFPGLSAYNTPPDKQPKNILIYNHFQNREHSLMLLSK